LKILYLILAGGDKSHTRDILSTRSSWIRTIPLESSYFELYSDPHLKKTNIQKNEIWANCGAEYTDILRKTVISLQALGPKLEDYDFVIRTNVSSYFNHFKIKKMLQKYKNQKYFYGGYIEESKDGNGSKTPFVSGAAIFWNSKTARIISEMNPDEYRDCPDDVAFSKLMKKHGVKTTFLPRGNICFHNFFTIASYYRLKSSIHSELAGIRIQNYHTFTMEKSILRKSKVLIKHQKLELSYSSKKEFIPYLAKCWQVSKIFFKYRVVK